MARMRGYQLHQSVAGQVASKLTVVAKFLRLNDRWRSHHLSSAGLARTRLGVLEARLNDTIGLLHVRLPPYQQSRSKAA